MILKCLLCVVDSHYNTSLFKEPRQRENSPTSVPHKVYRICTWGSVVRIWKLICSWGFPNLLMEALWSGTYQYLNPTHLERLLGIFPSHCWAGILWLELQWQPGTTITKSRLCLHNLLDKIALLTQVKCFHRLVHVACHLNHKVAARVVDVVTKYKNSSWFNIFLGHFAFMLINLCRHWFIFS